MKTKIELLVEDDFMEEFMALLPRDKVSVINLDFSANEKKFHKALETYRDSSDDFIPYFKSMKNISAWFNAKRV